ncbi:phosphatase [Soehngenia saccharolytica]|nr:phosphatase [Soehngenia saccharolytica]
MIYALVDIGSNTMRMNIYKCKNNNIDLLFTSKQSAGLAGYVENGIMSKKGIKKAIEALKSFMEIVNHFEIDKMYVFATAALRNVYNSESAVSEIENATGLDIDVISGEQEARLDFIGATKLFDLKEGILVDIGGGSTEIVTFKNQNIISAISFPLGSLNSYKMYVSEILPNKKEIKDIKNHLERELSGLTQIDKENYKVLCGVGGSIRATRKLHNWIYEAPSDNNTISSKNLKSMVKFLSKGSKESIDAILQVSPDRVHTILPGIIILNEIVKKFGSDEIIVSDYGVREGYLFEKVLKE